MMIMQSTAMTNLDHEQNEQHEYTFFLKFMSQNEDLAILLKGNTVFSLLILEHREYHDRKGEEREMIDVVAIIL